MQFTLQLIRFLTFFLSALNLAFSVRILSSFFFRWNKGWGQEDRWLAGSNVFALSFPGIFFHFFSLNSSTHICIFSIIAHACAAAAAACASQAVCPAPKTIEIRRRCSSCGEKAFFVSIFWPTYFCDWWKEKRSQNNFGAECCHEKKKRYTFFWEGGKRGRENKLLSFSVLSLKTDSYPNMLWHSWLLFDHRGLTWVILERNCPTCFSNIYFQKVFLILLVFSFPVSGFQLTSYKKRCSNLLLSYYMSSFN